MICVPSCAYCKTASLTSAAVNKVVGRCNRRRKAVRGPGLMDIKKRKGPKVHIAVDTLGHLLALHVTPANEQDRAQIGELAKAIQAVVDEKVELAFVDQGYTGSEPAAAAAKEGIQLKFVKHHEAKRGFVLLPRRWVVERSFAWVARFRRLPPTSVWPALWQAIIGWLLRC